MNLDSIKLHYNSLQKRKNIDKKIQDFEDFYTEDNEVKNNHDFFVKKIKNNDFYTLNEISISKKIMSISNYYDYFNILLKYENIEINSVDEKNIENIEIDNKKFILGYYSKYKSISSFFSFLLNSKTPSELIHNIIESYIHLNKTLFFLNKMNICFYDISPEKINVFENRKPLLCNFEKSINIDNLTIKYLSKIIDKDDNYTYKSIENHILFYLLVNKEETLKEDISNEIISNYIKNLKILGIYSTIVLNETKGSLYRFMEKYINKPRSFIIEEMIQYIDTWDNYSLGFIYMFILSNVIRVFKLKDTFINKLTSLILSSINSIPSRRENLLDITEKIINLCSLSNPQTFEFINEMDSEKMEDLYEKICM